MELIGCWRHGPLDGLVPGAIVFRDTLSLEAAMKKRISNEGDSREELEAHFKAGCKAISSVQQAPGSDMQSIKIDNWDDDDSDEAT